MSDTKKPKTTSAKKTEVIELRLSPEDKSAFMEACRMEGQSASAVLRDGIHVYLKNGYFGENRRSIKMLISGFLAGGISIAALFTVVPYLGDEISPIASEKFANSDTNHDGYVSLGEFLAPVSSQNKKVIIKSGQLNLETDQGLKELDQDITKKVRALLKEHKDANVQFIKTPSTHKASTACHEAMIAFNASNFTLEFSRLDTNNDNKLSVKEFAQSSYVPQRKNIQTLFNTLDVNKDGILREAEVKAPPQMSMVFAAQLKPSTHHASIPAACQKDAGVTLSSEPQTVIFSLSLPQDTLEGNIDFDRFDLNADSKITLKEYLRAHRIIS